MDATNKVDSLLNQLEDLAVEKINRLEANNSQLEERLAKLEALLTSQAEAAEKAPAEIEPSTSEEPLADKESSAGKEPSASKKPSAEPLTEAAVIEEIEEQIAQTVAEKNAVEEQLEAAVAAKEAAPVSFKPKQELAKWVKTYPEIFIPHQPKPLKIGIHQDLVAATGLTEQQVKRVLANYVKLPRYFACVLEGANRIDLANQEGGQVTAEEAAFAKQELNRLKQQKKQKLYASKKPANRAAKDKSFSQPAVKGHKPRPNKPQPTRSKNRPVKNPIKPREKAFSNNALQEQLEKLLSK